MQDCWTADPDSRKSPRDVVKDIHDMRKTGKAWLCHISVPANVTYFGEVLGLKCVALVHTVVTVPGDMYHYPLSPLDPSADFLKHLDQVAPEECKLLKLLQEDVKQCTNPGRSSALSASLARNGSADLGLSSATPLLPKCNR